MPTELIVSPDVRRANRLPPGQREVAELPKPLEGPVPTFDPSTWTLAVFPMPLVEALHTFTWAEFLTLPRVQVLADYHGVDRQSKLDNLWEGVSTQILLDFVKPVESAKYVMIHAEYGYSTNLKLDDFFADDVVLATHCNGEQLTPEFGAPVRLVVPRLYSWKSLCWVRGVEFMDANRPGFRESPANGGHHLRGDPWAEPDGNRFQD